MADADYKNHPNPKVRELASLPEGEPLFPGEGPEWLRSHVSEYPQDIRQALITESLRDALQLRHPEQTGQPDNEKLDEGQQRVSADKHLITPDVELAALIDVARALDCDLELIFRPKQGAPITILVP